MKPNLSLVPPFAAAVMRPAGPDYALSMSRDFALLAELKPDHSYVKAEFWVFRRTPCALPPAEKQEAILNLLCYAHEQFLWLPQTRGTLFPDQSDKTPPHFLDLAHADWFGVAAISDGKIGVAGALVSHHQAVLGGYGFPALVYVAGDRWQERPVTGIAPAPVTNPTTTKSLPLAWMSSSRTRRARRACLSAAQCFSCSPVTVSKSRTG